MLENMSEVDSGYTFNNGLCLPVATYCDDITMLGWSKDDVERLFQRLVHHTDWLGLEINLAKSAYTHSRNTTATDLLVLPPISQRLGRPSLVTRLMSNSLY